MANEALRRALADARLRDVDVASRMGVDPKTVRRWIDGRVPLLRHRWALADLVRRDENDLWPDAQGSPSRHNASGEVLATYPHRNSVPREVWRKLFEAAQDQIGILAGSGMLLAEDEAILSLLGDKARVGVRVRILLSDPDHALDTRRPAGGAQPEVTTDEMREAIAVYRPLGEVPGVEIRLHRTALYTSMCRADNELLVNPHLYGVPDGAGPVLYLRRSEGTHMVASYLEAFHQVWKAAVPLK